jgi:antirestriction protein ArdC
MYREVTEQIVTSLEKAISTGESPVWIRPWKTLGAFRNAITNRPYSGINTILLSFTKFSDPRWITFSQAKKAGGQVKKGSKSVSVVFWKFIKKEDEMGNVKTIPFLRTFNLFNVEQVDGLNLKPIIAEENKEGRDERLDQFIQNTGTKIEEKGSGACYIPSEDRIEVPVFAHFKSAAGFYGTTFHELAHWTGHKDRLDRNLQTRFGTEAYAAEELVAELGSAFLARSLGVNGSMAENHTAYLASWLKALKNDKHMIFKASSLAEKAAKFIMEKMGVTKEEVVEEVEEEAVPA